MSEFEGLLPDDGKPKGGPPRQGFSGSVPPWEKAARLGGFVYPGRTPPAAGTVMWGESTKAKTREYPVVRNVTVSEQDYVAGEVEVTRAQIEAGVIRAVYRDKDGSEIDDRQGRLERTASYARWRYRGFLAGQITSL